MCSCASPEVIDSALLIFLTHLCLPPPWFLDVYVFGVGNAVNTDNINELASKKPGEMHSFKLKDVTDLQEAFESMIGNVNQHGFSPLTINN